MNRNSVLLTGMSSVPGRLPKSARNRCDELDKAIPTNSERFGAHNGWESAHLVVVENK